MVGLKNFVVWGAIVANRYLNSMGGSLIGTSVLTTSLIIRIGTFCFISFSFLSFLISSEIYLKASFCRLFTNLSRLELMN